MSVLASIVPIASDPVITALYAGYSALAARRVWRSRLPQSGDHDEGAEPEPAASLLRIQDRHDAASDYLDDLGRAMPLSLPVLWFGLSVPGFWAAGRVAEAVGLLAAAGLSFVPLFLTARDGIFKAFVRWRTGRLLARPIEEQRERIPRRGGEST